MTDTVEGMSTAGGGSSPVGGARTATFLLGDVVGSTRLWADRPQSMSGAIAAFDAHVSEAVAAHGGTRPVEQGEGDSFVASFPRAADAVACALAIQVAVARTEIAVRMAVHTGDAEQRTDGRWMGPALNRTARLRALAAGGQILVSGPAAALIVDHLPARATLRDLGRHRLRDLARPEEVRQLCHPDLPDDFPPLASLDRCPNNLPTELTSFVGRDSELESLAELLGGARLVTVAGAGGAGKTRLAVHSAAQLVDQHPGGVWIADLAGIADPGLVPNVLAGAMSLPEQPLQAVADTIAAALTDQASLIIFDNCEHVLDAAAELVGQLLRSCLSVQLLVTSREPLGISGERVYRIPSLVRAEAIALFVDRAAAVRPSFRLDERSKAAVTEICERLDGLPLAIELAAARVRMMSPAELLEKLTGRLRILSAGRSSVLPRQRTLEASVQWSFDLLSEVEQALLRRLTVFAGGFTMAGAEDVCAGDPVDHWDIVDLLGGLVDKSLVQAEEVDGNTRYRMLETVRVFAAHRLADAGEVASYRARHASHIADVALGVEADLVGEFHEAYRRFGHELHNWRAAFQWAIESEEPELAWRLITPVLPIWDIRFQEAGPYYDVLLELGGGTPRQQVSVFCECAATVCIFTGQFAKAHVFLDAARMAILDVDDPFLGGIIDTTEGWIKLFEGDPTALPSLQAGAATLADSGESWWRASAFLSVGLFELFAGRVTASAASLGKACEAAGSSTILLAQVRGIEAFVLASRGDYTAAETAARFARDALGDIPSPAIGITANLVPTWCLTADGRHDEALGLVDEVLADFRRFGMIPFIALGGWLRAWVGWRGGRPIDDEAMNEAEATLAFVPLLPWGPAMLRALRAEHALAAGDLVAAAAQTREAETAAEASELAGWAWPVTKRTAARVSLAAGDIAAAEDRAHQALARFAASGVPWGVAETLETLAHVAAELESWEEAVRLLGGAAAIRERISWVPGRPEEAELALLGDRLATALGGDGYQRARADGAAMSEDEVVAYAVRGRGERKRPSFGWASLTPTESDVVGLVAEGMRNKDIARKLFMSEATVKTHLNRVFTKLGVTSRTELAAQAMRSRPPER